MTAPTTVWKRMLRPAAGLGCLTSLAGPLLGLLLYPRANWLFGLLLIGFLILYLDRRFAKDPTPLELADEIERLLTDNYSGWDVDDFEMQAIRDPLLKDLHRRCISIGLPEEWPRLNQEQKDKLWEIIRELRTSGQSK